MTKKAAGVLITLSLDPHSLLTLQRQLYDGLRTAILAGRLGPGRRLPSTRSLADDLAVSRNTVAAAFGQLIAEGYAEARVGAGTTVARTLPEDLRNVTAGLVPPEARFSPRISRRGGALSGARVSAGFTTLRPFRPGWPALDQVPLEKMGVEPARTA